MTDVLHVQNREQTGTKSMRRLRASGKTPAILYGHGKANVSLSIESRDVDALIRHGSHIVQLEGSVSDSALVKDVQWDELGSEVLHLDLTRIDASESVEVELSIELKGIAPGTKQGGIIKHIMHEVTVRCPADKLPDKLELSINQLELDGTLTASDLVVPEAAELLCEPDDVVVSCVTPVVVEEPAEEEAEVAEPELIGKAPEDEEGKESED